VLLVGDAAGADPLFGEGISIALGYGVVAAREIGELLGMQTNAVEVALHRALARLRVELRTDGAPEAIRPVPAPSGAA
jgi:flavin-dependent dehydrogenase